MRVAGPCLVVVVYVLLTLLRLNAEAPKAIEVFVSPRMSFAPATVFVRVRVQATDGDRWISVATDSGEFSRRSDWTIEPDRALYSFFWRDLPQGDYEVLARIGHGDVVRASDRMSVMVRGIGP